MPCTFDTVRQLALAFPGVEEATSYGTPSFHIRRKFMARMREDGETLVVRVDPRDRPGFLERSPDTFLLTEHYVSYPLMLVNLLAIHETELRAVLAGAWRFTAPERLVSAHDHPR